MKLSARVRYGSRAMLDLALHQQDGPVPLEVLAREQQMPARYLAKIIQDMRRGGIIRSVRGAHGGYMLARPPRQITLLDVWEALEGPIYPSDCLKAPGTCDRQAGCVTRDVWDRVGQAVTKVLASENLAGLVRKYRAKAAVTE